MAQIVQAPAELDLVGVQGDPFGISVAVTVVDLSGNPVGISSLTAEAEVTGTDQYDPSVRALSHAAPTVTVGTPTGNQATVTVSWTADQTAAWSEYASTNWALSFMLNGDGPYAVLAGSAVMGLPTEPGASTSDDAALTVVLGPAPVNLAITV